jgi:hypothetical protein
MPPKKQQHRHLSVRAGTLLDTGHFALEEEATKIAGPMPEFLGRRVFSEARR